MAAHKYAFKVEDNMAKAVGRDLNISTKQSVAIAKFLRGKSLERARAILEGVIFEKIAVPYTRYNKEMPHRKKIGPGGYPKKAAREFLKLLGNVTANAQSLGLATSKLEIIHICVHRAAAPVAVGRHRHGTKRSHVEVVVREEIKKEKKKKLELGKEKTKEAEPQLQSKPKSSVVPTKPEPKHNVKDSQKIENKKPNEK